MGAAGVHSSDPVSQKARPSLQQGGTICCMGKGQRSVATTSTADQDKPAQSARFRSLPERIRPEDMTTAQETEPPPDPEMGRDTDHDFLMRNLGG